MVAAKARVGGDGLSLARMIELHFFPHGLIASHGDRCHVRPERSTDSMLLQELNQNA